MSSLPAPDRDEADVGDPSILRRVTLSSLIGTAAEYYDYVLYATMTALVFDRLFFSGVDPALASTAAFGTLAVGYVARPIGGDGSAAQSERVVAVPMASPVVEDCSGFRSEQPSRSRFRRGKRKTLSPSWPETPPTRSSIRSAFANGKRNPS